MSSLSESRVFTTGRNLVAVAGVIGATGMTLVSVAVAVAARRWLAQPDVAPRRFARRQWDLTRAAVNAGAGAWRSEGRPGNGATPSGVPVAANSR